jgi:hypothetical protein
MLDRATSKHKPSVMLITKDRRYSYYTPVLILLHPKYPPNLEPKALKYGGLTSQVCHGRNLNSIVT